ncbi:MAG TPA: A/G-specific adenine glycosylase [Candidatus Angelobacter sp.]|nr:A/G-specific adenine glycosylase [Candidatus Angelobacter sp.]
MSRAKAILTTRDFAAFRERLLCWFDREKRRLPWRGETDPYRILVSEIMLQQTRVAVVEQRYRQFLRRFPTMSRLARARTATVLAAWSGLGYYRRARSLHAAAKEVAGTRRFPKTAAELRALPGVGRYTANAVASIAFGEPVPVVDGNVKRALSRLSGETLSDERCWTIAGALLDVRRPGDFNQAMMELGALVCLPRQPMCTDCPVRCFCAAQGAGSPRAQSPRKKAVLNYALVLREDSILMQQRPRSASLMAEMWELPLIENGACHRSRPLLKLRHSITDTDYLVSVFAMKKPSSRRGRWVPLKSSRSLPLTGLARKILSRLQAA